MEKAKLLYEDETANEAALKITHDRFYEIFGNMILHDEPLTSEKAIYFGAYMLEIGMEVARLDMEMAMCAKN